MHKMKKKLTYFFVLLTCLFAMPCLAQGDDADAPTKIVADKLTYIDSKQITVLNGHVRLTRGTTELNGDKIIIREDNSGRQFETVYGKPATFKQKRNGEGDLWVYGQAERIEYDSKTEIAKFYNQAKLTRLDGKKITDEIEGGMILYNTRTEYYTVNQSPEQKNTGTSKRIKVLIQPKNNDTKK